jgi:hypothetical protein
MSSICLSLHYSKEASRVLLPNKTKFMYPVCIQIHFNKYELTSRSVSWHSEPPETFPSIVIIEVGWPNHLSPSVTVDIKK